MTPDHRRHPDRTTPAWGLGSEPATGPRFLNALPTSRGVAAQGPQRADDLCATERGAQAW